MTRALRDILLVARFDLLESLRSRRAVAILSIYAIVSGLSTLAFAQALKRLAQAAQEEAQRFGVNTESGVLDLLLESDQFHALVAGLVRDPELADALVAIHPLALFYGATAFGLIGLLVLFTSATTLTEDIASGAVRFQIFRTTRRRWAAGKLLGQSLLMATGLALGALAALVAGAVALPGEAIDSLIQWLPRVASRAWILGFAYLGLFLGVSQLTRSVGWARSLCLFALVGCAAGSAVSGSLWFRDLVPGAGLLHALFPPSHRLALWHPAWAERLPALVILAGFGAATFWAGTTLFARRDA